MAKTKVVGASKAKVVKKVDQKPVQVAAPEKAEVKPVEHTCECGATFESIYSGAKYCPSCAAAKKKARRKAASKRRIQNRKSELVTLRQFRDAVYKTINGKATAAAKVKEIEESLFSIIDTTCPIQGE